MAALLLASSCARKTPPASRPAGPEWVIAPDQPGPDLPPVGRSRFDFLVRDGIPFPFEKLVEKAGPGFKGVLIPLGRSLQRSRAAPDFFASPRAVVAIDDRLFLGYQPKAGVIEVIAYNEEAGRFEFQLVRGYTAGASPRVYYAPRKVCTACHRNQSPIFSRPLWDETNGNPKIADGLAASLHGTVFSAIPARQGVDIPYTIDLAVHRADMLSLCQRIWREACTPADRAALWTAVLRHALSGWKYVYYADSLSSIQAYSTTHWPRGLGIANPEIPNRDPFRDGEDIGRKNFIDDPFDPSRDRPPLGVWRGDSSGMETLVEGLGGFLSVEDAGPLDRALAAGSGAAEREICDYHCSFEQRLRGGRVNRAIFHCANPELAGVAYFSGGQVVSGQIDSIEAAPGQAMANVVVRAGTWRPGQGGGLAELRFPGTRRPDGNALEKLTLEWRGTVGRARLVTVADFSALGEAVAGLLRDHDAALASPVFRRAALLNATYARLGLGRRLDCCFENSGLAPPAVTSDPQ